MNIKDIENYMINNFTIMQLVYLLMFCCFVAGFVIGNSIGIYTTTLQLTEIVNETANNNNSILMLDNLNGNIESYVVYHYQSMNLTNIRIGE